MMVTGQVANAVSGALTGQDQGDVMAGPLTGSMSTGAPFAGVLRSMVDETNGLQDKATDAVTGLLNGSGVEVHDAMIATQKASMAFELALQVRNKAVGAYQQMMGMQF